MEVASDVMSALERLQDLRAGIIAGERIATVSVSRERLAASLAALGITRVGDLTDLDRLGVPVWFATRPRSRSLCVSNGKGMTKEEAWISAVMESAEQALAEQAVRVVAEVESMQGMAQRGLRVVPLERQSRCAARHLSADEQMAWVSGLSWRTGETIYAPYELVGMDMLSGAPWNHDQFRMTSSGLACGGDLLRAIVHGVCELIEDDSAFVPLAANVVQPVRAPLQLSRQHADLTQLLARLETHGIEAGFRELTDDIGVPTIIAALRSTQAEEDGTAYFSGLGCRCRREDAALAALLEAVQSRLTFISGARDDLFKADYGHSLTSGTRSLFGSLDLVDAAVASADASEDLRELACKVTASGRDLYLFPLGGTPFGLEAVRVLADDLVSVDAPETYQRTGRAARKLLQGWGQEA